MLFAEIFSKNSNLDDSKISIPLFPSRTNPKLNSIPVTPKLLKKVITNLDLLKASGPDCIPVIAVKKSKPVLSYVLGELFNICLKESCFLDWWKVSSVVLVFLVFRNVGRGLWRKTTALIVFVLWFVKSLKNLLIIDLLITSRNVTFF